MKELSLSLHEFERLPNKEQHAVLFQNQCKTMELINLYNVKYDKVLFNQKIQYALIAGLISAAGYILTIHIKF